MKIVVTFETYSYNYIKFLRGCLLANHHTVIRVINKVKPQSRLIPRFIKNLIPLIRIDDYRRIPLDADMWLYGLDEEQCRGPIDPCHVDLLRRFKGHIAFYQNGDLLDFSIDRIPPDLVEKASLFLRNNWPADETKIHPAVRSRAGFVNPFLKRKKPVYGASLGRRPHGVMFYGVNTGLGGQAGNRIRAIRLLKEHERAIAFTGGLIHTRHSAKYAPVPPDLLVDELSTEEHDRILSSSKICLALCGDNPATYRFFEGLSRRCLVLAQDFSDVNFKSCGLRAGVHYVVIRRDLSDCIEKISYYLAHLDEAQKIADEGYGHYKKNIAIRGVRIAQPLYEEIVASWKNLYRPVDHPSLSSRLFASVMPYIKNM
jgi:hypothetical protein